MTYNTKAEFMAALKSQAEKYSLSFGEMAEDFERHFSEGEENGETESEICAKLGDPVEMSTLQAEALFLIHTHFRNDSKGYKPITK